MTVRYLLDNGYLASLICSVNTWATLITLEVTQSTETYITIAMKHVILCIVIITGECSSMLSW